MTCFIKCTNPLMFELIHVHHMFPLISVLFIRISYQHRTEWLIKSMRFEYPVVTFHVVIKPIMTWFHDCYSDYTQSWLTYQSKPCCPKSKSRLTDPLEDYWARPRLNKSVSNPMNIMSLILMIVLRHTTVQELMNWTIFFAPQS